MPFCQGEANNAEARQSTTPTAHIKFKQPMPVSLNEPTGQANGTKEMLPRDFSKRQIDALPAQQRMLAVGERRYAMKRQPRRPAPHRDVAMLEPEAARLVAAREPAEQEGRRQAQ